MAKKKKAKAKAKEGLHLSYCAGKGWEGDGTKATSTCPFNKSREITATRYACNYCITATLPRDVVVAADFTTERDAEAVKKAKPVEMT